MQGALVQGRAARPVVCTTGLIHPPSLLLCCAAAFECFARPAAHCPRHCFGRMCASGDCLRTGPRLLARALAVNPATGARSSGAFVPTTVPRWRRGRCCTVRYFDPLCSLTRGPASLLVCGRFWELLSRTCRSHSIRFARACEETGWGGEGKRPAMHMCLFLTTTDRPWWTKGDHALGVFSPAQFEACSATGAFFRFKVWFSVSLSVCDCLCP